jgi:hypothetical protein
LKERSPGQTAVSLSISKEVLDRIDARAAALGISRSSYLTLLAQQDLSGTVTFPLPPVASAEPQLKPLALTEEAYEFLVEAVPALEEYACRKAGEPPTGAGADPPPEDLTETRLWRFFLLEREEILRHKYLRSEALGRDIGLHQAIKEWLQQHHALWAAAHPPSET